VECKDLPSIPFLLTAVCLITTENNGSWPPKLLFIDSRWKDCSFVANVLPTRLLNISVLSAFENLSPVSEDLLEMLLGRNNIAADMLVTLGNHRDYADSYLFGRLRMKEPRAFRTSGTDYSVTERCIPEGRKPHMGYIYNVLLLIGSWVFGSWRCFVRSSPAAMAGVAWAWCCPWSRVTREGVCIKSKFISGRKWGTSVVCSYQVTGRYKQHVLLSWGAHRRVLCVTILNWMRQSSWNSFVADVIDYVICG